MTALPQSKLGVAPAFLINKQTGWFVMQEHPR
jgi:hypothetical protein